MHTQHIYKEGALTQHHTQTYIIYIYERYIITWHLLIIMSWGIQIWHYFNLLDWFGWNDLLTYILTLKLTSKVKLHWADYRLILNPNIIHTTFTNIKDVLFFCLFFSNIKLNRSKSSKNQRLVGYNAHTTYNITSKVF